MGSFSLVLVLVALAAKPLDPNQFNRMGVQYAREGNYAKAAESFRQSFALEPRQPIIRYNLFNALNNLSIESARQDKVDEAIAACSEALRIIPEDVRVASNLAIFFQNQAVELLEKKQFAEAQEAILDAQKVVDQFGLGKIAATIRETRGRIYLLEGRDKFARNDVSEALDLYDKCLQVNPEEALAYLDRSRIYYEQDFFQDAIADLEMALEILGQNPEILSLVQRLKIEAGKKGQTLSDQDAFFILESPGANPSQDQVLKRVLKDIRLTVARNLTVNPKTPLVVSIRWSEPFIPYNQWLSSPGLRLEGDRISMGGGETDPNSEAFREALALHYVGSLVLNIGGSGIPYWFAVGLAQYLHPAGGKLSPDEVEQLLSAGENFLLFRVEDLVPEKITRLEDSGAIRLAYLQSKALVAELVDSIRMNGLRQLMRSLSAGVPFDQALKDIANLTVEEIDRDWKKQAGLRN
ncbi:tetratricopeptide repeat protein [bacterium]|nr:tetratricopeptide repeat protein [bacterium]NUP93468.1 hypothetical protein [Candidatus Omnitrophota bacterium]